MNIQPLLFDELPFSCCLRCVGRRFLVVEEKIWFHKDWNLENLHEAAILETCPECCGTGLPPEQTVEKKQ